MKKTENRKTILLIGGCRSGKSRHALEVGAQLLGDRNIFVATCEPRDAEMAARIARHRRERGIRWRTVEEPIDLAGCLAREGAGADVVLVDCLTLWISNLMAAEDSLDDDAVMARVERLCACLAEPPCPVILVTNEVGAGIVPEAELARRFRDLTGWANQRVAAVCSQVIWMVAGLPVPIKGIW